jgi:hypothetical protein
MRQGQNLDIGGVKLPKPHLAYEIKYSHKNQCLMITNIVCLDVINNFRFSVGPETRV